MARAESLAVEVVYALAERQHRIRLRVAAGTTVGETVRLSGILTQAPEIDLAHAKLGIFSRRVAPDAQVHDGDRIEIYRPLLADPKSARRERARNLRT